MTVFSTIEIFFIVTYYVIAIWILIKILLENRDPTKTIAYLFVLLFLPIFGIIVYYLFGQNLRKEKLFDRKAVADKARLRGYLDSTFQKKEFKIKEALNETQQRLISLLKNNDRASLSDQNEVSIFENGENTFDEMLNEIALAKHHIHLEYYIFRPDEVGSKFEALLIKKAKEGVKVRLIYDDVGSLDFKEEHAQDLRLKGVLAYPFMPVKFPRFTSKINFRNHRKVLIIDGEKAFLGGINIKSTYDNRIANKLYWRDLSIKIKGNAVQNLQQLFLLNWYFVSNEVVNYSNDYFKSVSVTDTIPIQIAASGPDSKWSSIMQSFLYAISLAKQNIWICTPYFIPNESILNGLKTAALAGVNVHLMIPKNPDSWVAKAASTSFLGELLEAGVYVSIYTKGMLHAKYLVVDDHFVTTGSANMDRRSFDQNFELNAVLYDQKMAQKFQQIFEKDKEHCYQLSLDQWKNRKTSNKVVQSFARLASPLL